MPHTQQDTLSFFRHAFLRHQPRRYAVMQPKGADRKYSEYSGTLSDNQISAHLAGRSAYAVPYGHAGLGHLLALDIDAGAPAAVFALLWACEQRGLWAFAQYDEQSERGYVYIPFDDQANLERLKILGDDLTSQVYQDGWQIDNRATEADTRLPLARHQHTGRRGTLIVNGAQLDLDSDPDGALEELINAYRENSTNQLPAPPPKPASKSAGQQASRATGPGYSIQDFNRDHDLTDMLVSYGATLAKGHGRRLFFCPFHDDRNASLTVYRNREGKTVCHCKSTHSSCKLSQRHGDAFYVYCIGEGLTDQQALRRLNGLPEDPEPKTGPPAPPAGSQTRHSPPGGNSEPPRRQSAPQQAAGERLKAIQQAWATKQQQAAYDDRLTRSDRRALNALAEAAAQNPYGDACKSNSQYAQAAQISPRTMQYSLDRLAQLGYISCQERGRDGQTNIYRPAAGIKQQPAAPIEQVPRAAGGAQKVAPTCEYMHDHVLESSRTRRGGQPDPAPAPQASAPKRADLPQSQAAAPEAPQASTEIDATGCYRGPGGAVAYPDGVAFVPPEAQEWYRHLLETGAVQIQQPPTPVAVMEPLPPVPEPPPVRYGPPQDEARRRKYFALLGKARKATSPKQRRYLETQARWLEEPIPAKMEPARPAAPPPARPGRRAPEPAQLGMFDPAEILINRQPADQLRGGRSRRRGELPPLLAP